jgi:Fe-S oxidoreductase/nitrate reductase gamma subunit
MPERIDFWGIPHDLVSPAIVVYIIMAVASLVMLYRLYRRARLWTTVGRPEARWDHLPTRVGRLVRYGLVQSKVLRQRYPGVMHASLAWGFFVFFAGTGLATLDSHFFKFLRGDVYLTYKLVLDLFTIAFLIGAAMAAWRRFVQRPARLTARGGFVWSLALIVVIVTGGLVLESLRLAAEQPAHAAWSPAGWAVARLWLASGATEPVLMSWHTGVWYFHLLSVALLMVTLPAGTLLHVITAPLNVFFADIDLSPRRLAPLRTTADGKPIYPAALADLTWKQLLDADACTECGRCQDACPADAAGLPLSPKRVMTAVRDALVRDAPVLAGGGNVPALVGEVIADEVLWSCTTCGACVQECPVLINHVDTIVDLRRHLVIEGRMDTGLQGALDNLGRYGNSFGKSPRARAKWTAAVEPKIKDARTESVEYLWFLGDYAAFSPSLTDITIKTAQVLRAAGVDFGILYDAEQNAGNDVRRIGEEGLFEMLVEKNQAALGACTYRAVVTGDPHSYNALKNEYPASNGTHRPVLHIAELLDEVITSGRLKLGQRLGYTVTYHDPCYLGRYNGVYDAPRRVIAATGCRLVEMPRHGDTSLCCGAGGGRIWMELAEPGERPGSSRIREAAALAGVSAFVVACPKDVTMYQDAVKTTGQEGRLVVKDLVELVHEAL